MTESQRMWTIRFAAKYRDAKQYTCERCRHTTYTGPLQDRSGWACPLCYHEHIYGVVPE